MFFPSISARRAGSCKGARRSRLIGAEPPRPSACWPSTRPGHDRLFPKDSLLIVGETHTAGPDGLARRQNQGPV